MTYYGPTHRTIKSKGKVIAKRGYWDSVGLLAVCDNCKRVDYKMHTYGDATDPDAIVWDAGHYCSIGCRNAKESADSK